MTTEKQPPIPPYPLAHRPWSAYEMAAIEEYGDARAAHALATAQQAEKRESLTVEQWCTNAFNEAHGITPGDAKGNGNG